MSLVLSRYIGWGCGSVAAHTLIVTMATQVCRSTSEYNWAAKSDRGTIYLQPLSVSLRAVVALSTWDRHAVYNQVQDWLQALWVLSQNMLCCWLAAV